MKCEPTSASAKGGRACIGSSRRGLPRGRTPGKDPVEDYKAPAAHHCGVVRSVLAGTNDDQTRFQVRYFEISPGGFSSREYHRHEHVVVVMRGRGEVWLDGTWHEVGFGDTVYVAPLEVHQFRNASAEPFGFLCVVDAERDAPVMVES